MIDYKYLHNLLLQRKKDIEEVSTYDESYAAEVTELETMMIAVRNMYKRQNGIPVRWKFGEPHPFKKRKRVLKVKK